MMKIVFATGNKGKLREAADLLGPDYEVVSMEEVGIVEDIEETGETLRENSIIKAEYVYEKTGLNCFADDTGLMVDCLDGAPGVHSARYATEGHDFNANIDKLLSEMEKHPGEPRTAHFSSVVTLIWNGEKHFFEGTFNGRIAERRAGNGGFGYDPVFIADACPDHSVAELPISFKNEHSHRAKALKAMAEWIRKQDR